jgi:hypothetical protein
MSDIPSKLTVSLLEETNFPSCRPAMEAHLGQLGVSRIVTSKRKEPEVPNYLVPTPASPALLTCTLMHTGSQTWVLHLI